MGLVLFGYVQICFLLNLLVRHEPLSLGFQLVDELVHNVVGIGVSTSVH